MGDQYDLVIVGMGSAGTVAAEFASAAGVRIAAVERGRIGGDCLWTGCVPSKALIASARVAHQIRTAGRFGLPPFDVGYLDTTPVWARLRGIREEIAASDDDPGRFRALGIEVILGQPARLTGPHTVVVGERRLETRFVLLCTGSRPAVPAVAGLEEAGYLTSETVFELERAPSSVAVIGGGAIALELAQALHRLGVRCEVLEQEGGLLPTEERRLVERLAGLLRAEGIGIHTGVRIERVTVERGEKVLHATVGGQARTWKVEQVLVAAGRLPNLEALGLTELGIRIGKAATAPSRLATNVKSVYAVGDLAGRHHFTHSAGHEAVQAVRDMFYPGRGRVPRVIPWCTFTDPELAHVGLTSEEAAASKPQVEIWESDFAHSDRARADGVAGGVVLITSRRRLVGAHILSPAAGEMIHELALAVQLRLRLSDLGRLVHVYPTLATSVGRVAARPAYENVRRLRWLIGRAGRRTG